MMDFNAWSLWGNHRPRTQRTDGGRAVAEDDEKAVGEGCLRCIVYVVVLVVVIGICALMSGCRSVEYVPVVEQRVDTVWESHTKRDSIYLHDSIHVKEGGDTVLVERWRTMYREKERRDTVYEATHDTVPMPVPVEKRVEVEKPLTWWQRGRMVAGEIFLALCGIALLVWVIKWAVMKQVRP